MDDARELVSLWQSLLDDFKPCFTRGGWVRFVQWVTGTVLCSEEHTVTQILTSMGLESRWRVLEHFAEYGSWDLKAVEEQLIRISEREAPTSWGGYRVVTLDDTKLHRTSEDVWGTCTFHESTARSPNRAETVRAHNWVVLGGLVVGKPWRYLPLTSRLYFRKSQLPVGETFRTKTQQAVELLREVDMESELPILAVFDGAYAMETVIRPCLEGHADGRRIDFVTRLRRDARLYHPLAEERPNPKGGRPRTWGRRMAAPEHHPKWKGAWERGRAYLYGRTRTFQYKRVICQWSVSGANRLVHAYVFQVKGYRKPWYLVTSAKQLSASQIVAAFAARFRQEDGFRDHKQRLGMEECRAWTKQPVLRTFQVQMAAQTLLRLLENRLNAPAGPGGWWHPPEWNPGKQHPSILDLRRLLWRHRTRFSKLLVRLEDLGKPSQAHFPCGRVLARAA
jgi:hypothetical protein